MRRSVPAPAALAALLSRGTLPAVPMLGAPTSERLLSSSAASCSDTAVATVASSAGRSSGAESFKSGSLLWGLAALPLLAAVPAQADDNKAPADSNFLPLHMRQRVFFKYEKRVSFSNMSYAPVPCLRALRAATPRARVTESERGISATPAVCALRSVAPAALLTLEPAGNSRR